MIPRLYSESETNFNSNGICALSETVSATVTEEANSIFTLELEYPIHGMWFSEIKRLRLIKALPNVGDEEHIFRIKEIVKSTNPKMVRIYASTKSEDLNGHIIKEFERKETAANVVLSSLPSAIYPPTNYLFHTDITTKVSPYWFMRNVTNSILGSEGSLVDLLGGGELKRNNDSLYLYRRRGSDNVTRVTPRKNLRGLEITESTKGLITRIQPYMILQDQETHDDIIVIGDVVSSPLANNYPNQIVVPMDFSGYELENKTQLDQVAALYFTTMNPGCDTPNVTLNVDLINIHDSSEYSKFKDFETVKLFDTVTVYVPRYDVDVLVKIVSVTFDVLREKVIKITAGQPSSTFVQDLNKTYNDKLTNVFETLKKDINTVMMSADGKNKVFTGPNEPDITISSEGDTWFKVLGNGEMEMYIFDGAYWQVVINANTSKEILDKIDQAETDIAQNIIDIESTLAKATQAEQDAGFSKDLAEEAKALGVTASSLAGEAKTNANTAMADALEAIRQVALNSGVAADANAEAVEARRLASLAEDNAQEALTKANTSVTDASKALTDATKAFNKSFKSSTVVYATSTNGNTPPTTGWASTHPTPSPDTYIWTRTTIVLNDNTPVVSYSVGKIGAKGDQGLKGDAGGQGIQGVPGANAPTITSVVRQFYLSTSNSTQTGGSWLSTVPVWSSGKYYWGRVVTTYSNDATSTSTPVLDNALNDSLITALEVKTANQTLSTTVTQHATLIESKANTTTVDAIAGRVTTTEGSISTIAGQVALKASTADVNTLTGRVTTAEGNITTQAGQIALRATTATVNTLTGRVSTAEGKITTQAGLIELKADTTTVNTLTGRVSAAEASLSVQSGKIELAATKTELTTAIEGMEIGGRNLWLNSSAKDSFSGWSTSGTKTLDSTVLLNGEPTIKFVSPSTSSGGMFKTVTGGLEPNTDFTYSFMVKSSVSLPIYNSTIAHMQVVGTSNMSNLHREQNMKYSPTSVPANKWTKVSVTFNTPVEAVTSETFEFRSYLWYVPENAVLYFGEFKLEKGNKATDWTPAPEDVDSAISTVQANLTVEAGKIASKVSQTDFNALNGRVGTAETTITQHTTAINLRATKTDLDATNGRVTTAEGALTVQAGQIALKASQTSVDTLTGRVGTAEANITANTTAINLRATKTSVDGLTGRVTTAEGSITTQAGQIALKANQSVVDTLTGRVSTTEAKIVATDGKVTTLTTKTDGHTTSIGQLQTSYSGLSSTVTQVKNNLEGMEIGGRNLIVNTESLEGYAYSTSDKYMNFNISRATKGATGYTDPFSATTIAIAEGVTYTASFFARTSVASVIMCYWYSPNTTIHAVSSTGQVGSGVDGGVFVTTSTDWRRYWVTWTQSTTTAVKRLIIGRNHMATAGTIVEIAGVKLEKGNKATDWSPAPEDYTTVTAFSALEQNLNGFKTTVANTYADKTTVTQLSTQWTTTTNLVNGHTSQIASLGTDINLRATKAELISQINLSPETILIASGKIQIKGDTYIDNGVIKTAHIADLAVSGAKIANASIASAKIISLDANKINVGTLTGHTINGAVIKGGSITGTNITGGTFYNSGSRGDFHVYDGMVRATSYNTVVDGTVLSEDGYITLRAGGTGSGSHVFLQSVTEVRATKPRAFSTFIPMVASEFRILGWTYLARNVWSTYGNGIEDMFVKPSDVGSLRVMSAGNGSYRPIMASAFNQSSSREFKENIKSLRECGLEVVRGFNIVTYNLKDDQNKEIQVGLIAEDNRIISSFEGNSINIYKMTSYNSKAIQELDIAVQNANKRISVTDSNVIKLVANDSIYGLRLNNLETEVFRLNKRIEELEKIA